MQKLLGHYLQTTLKMLMQKSDSEQFEFHVKSSLLWLLYEETHAYLYVHQALAEMVTTDCD